ncbi:MAG: sucrose phosphorylase [Steroidobacteraceae bacterium]
MKNQVQLITYVDRLSGGGLRALQALLDGPLAGLFGAVHLLPFFRPIDGADAGFDPIDHTQVDERLGTWEDLRALASRIDIMADVIVNHISSDSPQFRDYSRKGRLSDYDGLFLTLDAVFPGGATERDLTAIYRPRPGLPLTPIALENGERKILWSTFTSRQLDIDVTHPQGRAYLERILEVFAANGIRMVRLDAAGYAVKRAGTSCFMLPETYRFIGEFTMRARALGMEVLIEVHSHYRRQIEIAAHADWIYDFALPPLVLHAISFRTARYLKEWIAIRPTNALTVLDTHDGIGIIDIGVDTSGPEPQPGLVPPEELERLVENIHVRSRGGSRRATGAAASNLDLYQANCSFYDALGRNDREYLMARALQFFLPGIPQVYYVGLLAGGNDLELLERTGIGRDINRHRFGEGEITTALERPVVRDLLNLIRLRNTHPAFSGAFEFEAAGEESLLLRWRAGGEVAELRIDFSARFWALRYTADGAFRRFEALTDACAAEALAP